MEEIKQKHINLFWENIEFPENLDHCWVWKGYVHPKKRYWNFSCKH